MRPQLPHGEGSMESTSCARGSGWACNELGIYVAEQRSDLANQVPPQRAFRRVFQLEFEVGCLNEAIVPGARKAGSTAA